MRLSCCLQVCRGQSDSWCMSSLAFAWKKCVCWAWGQPGSRAGHREKEKAHTVARESQDLQVGYKSKNNGL